MTVRLSVAVQAHPSRQHLAEPLAAELGAKIVYDPEPDAARATWRTYRAALEATPADATHRLIVQDDATPCASFAVAAVRAVSASPNGLVVFWHGGVPRQNLMTLRRAAQSGSPWAELTGRGWGRPVVPTVALCWPAEVIEPALAYVDEQTWTPRFVADDEIVGHIAKALDLCVCATVPSLVEHSDAVPSVKSGRTTGKDPARVAAYFIGGGDPLQISWCD